MSQAKNKTFSIKQLMKWGLLNVALREEIIDNYIIRSPQPTEEMIHVLMEKWSSENNVSSPEDLRSWKEKNGIEDEELKEIIVRNWRWESWCKNHFKDILPSYFLKRKASLDQVTYSLIRVKKKNLASELYLRIKESEASFNEIASSFSIGPERYCGGLLGPVPLNEPHPILSRMLQASTNGQLWPPKKIDEWWIIFRLENLHRTALNEDISKKLALELGKQHVNTIIGNSNSYNFIN